MSDDSAAKHRAKQTARNLTLSIIACLGIVLATVLIVPRDDSNRIQPVDYRASAASAEAASGHQILAPELPQGWWANRAKWTANPADGVAFWKVGFVGPKNQWIGMTQAFEVNPTWVALLSKDYAPDLEAIDSNPNWTKWASQDEGSEPTLWTLAVGNDLVALNGSGTAEEFAAFATIIETAVIK